MKCNNNNNNHRKEAGNNSDDGGQHQHQAHYYRYNHYPLRSSYSYSSSNLSSYRNNTAQHDKSTSLLSSSSSSTTFVTYSSSSNSSPQLSSSSLSHVEEDDHFSTILMEESSSNHNDNNSAPSSSSSSISLYQVFAGVNNSAATTTSLSMSNDDKIMTTSHYSTTNESLEGHPNNDADNNNNDNDNDDDESNENFNNSNEDCTDRNHDHALQQQTQQQQQHDDDDDNKEKDKHHSIHNNLQNLITKYRNRLGTLVLSMAALWIYSQLRTTTTTTASKRRLRYNGKQLQQRRRQLYDYSSRAMDVIRYLLRMISIPVSSMIRRRLTLQQQQPNLRISTTTTKVPTSSSSWKDAIPTPLSHLLALAESGNISKVIVHGGSSMLTYLHHHDAAVPSSSSSSQHPNNHYPSKQQQQQRWSKTTLPSTQNSTILNQIISTLLQKGCHDISTIPESTWSRFWNGSAIMALPFVYLGALYWIMRRLQREQLEDSDDTTTNGGGGGTSTTTTTTTTFADVAGINSSLQELSEVVSFLRHPNVFHSIGASPPRGILLHGPPGVGKTLLARAIAGELTSRRNSNDDDSSSSKSNNSNNLGQNYNTIDAFVVCSGSDFVETYVGRGAARVRALFRKVREDAWKNFQKRRHLRRREKRITTTKRLYSDVGCSSSSKPSSEQQQRHDDNRSSSVLSRAVSDVGERMVGAWEGLQTLVGQQHPNILSRYDDDDDDVHDTPLAIIFIDEIDALAKQRDSGVGGGFSSSLGGNDEREQTLNQLLTEMDGFNSGGVHTTDNNNNNVTVIVIAATNRPHVLDPAILRSGRFDRHVAVHLPDCQGREDILRLHAQRIRYDESSVNLKDIAKITPQFSGADLKCLINEAALLAVRSGSRMVLQEHLSQAAQKVKKSRR